MKSPPLAIPLLSSCLLHGLLLFFALAFHQGRNVTQQKFFAVDLLENPPAVERPAIVQPPPPVKPARIEAPAPQVRQPARNKSPIIAERKPAATSTPAPIRPAESNPVAPGKIDGPPPPFASGSEIEGGGSAAGAGNLFESGDIGVVPGAGTSGGGGGTAASGLGRGAGPPGLPADTGPVRTNREATPIKTVRAVYPAMALRAGLESDVTLKIVVDAGGAVTDAEVVKSGGAGFDEEALKAVRQSRFEPAQRNGKPVPAEFTFIYKFRLRR